MKKPLFLLKKSIQIGLAPILYRSENGLIEKTHFSNAYTPKTRELKIEIIPNLFILGILTIMILFMGHSMLGQLFDGKEIAFVDLSSNQVIVDKINDDIITFTRGIEVLSVLATSNVVYPLVKIKNMTDKRVTGKVSYASSFCSNDNYTVNPGQTWTAKSRGSCLLTKITGRIDGGQTSKSYRSSGTSYSTFTIVPNCSGGYQICRRDGAKLIDARWYPCPTCSDGIRNQGETGIDCGGPCDGDGVCLTCDDGIQNQAETGIDCGGPNCPACPLSIGDIYEGGYIFYLDPSGEHGLVASQSDLSEGNNWYQAVESCNNYNGGTYDDWFLPSKEQLNLMWMNLADSDGNGLLDQSNTNNIGRFSIGNYWSSTSLEDDNAYAWYQYFYHYKGNYNGYEDFGSRTESKFANYGDWYVRAARAF